MARQSNLTPYAAAVTGRWISTILFIAAFVYSTGAIGQNACEKPVYFTFDTGNMDDAPLIADVLNRQNVKATFFASNERTRIGEGALGTHWAPWWKARAAEGHEFASLTYDRVVWRGDVRGVAPRFRIQPGAGAMEGREFTWDAQKYCDQIAYANERLLDQSGKKPLPLFRAPLGRTSPRLLTVARACGFAYVGWSATGDLGDDLPSERYSNAALLKKALKSIKPGDILQAQMGSWTRKDPWAPAVLEPLIMGLKDQGFCFATLREHPSYKAWIAASPK